MKKDSSMVIRWRVPFNILILFAWVALSQLTVLSASAQSVNLPDATEIPSHPRILLLNGEEKGIKKTVKADKNWKKAHEMIIKESISMLSQKPAQRKLNGIRLLPVSRESIRRIFYLSYAWRMTKDKRFLERAEKELLTVAAFEDWNPQHYLDVAEMTLAVSIGYDWLFHDLTPQTKTTLKEAIITKGLEPSMLPRNNSWVQRTNNWNQVCNAGMAFGAIAVYEDRPELAKQIIERAIKSVPLVMAGYAPSGAYPEGYTYWGYGTTFNILFIDALQRAFGTDYGLASLPGFLNTGHFVQHMVGPTGKSYNYSDGTESTELNPAMFWLAKRQQDYSILFTEKEYLREDPELVKNRMLPAALIWGAGVKTKKIEAPKELIWVGHGATPVALMRTSWTDKNSIYVGFKGGSPSGSHAQMDIGSFVMDANNERWAMDLGMQDYTTLEAKGVALWDYRQNGQRWEVLRHNNLFHNTLALNNSLQLVKGFAPITGYSDESSFLSAVADLSSIYNNNVLAAERGVAIVDNNYVVVRDEIKTNNKQTTVRWSMVTPAQVTIKADGTAELTQNGKMVQLKAFGPSKITFKTWKTEPIKDFDMENPGTIVVGFETELPANTESALTVLLVPEKATVQPEMQNMSLKKWPLKKAQ